MAAGANGCGVSVSSGLPVAPCGRLAGNICGTNPPVRVELAVPAVALALAGIYGAFDAPGTAPGITVA